MILPISIILSIVSSVLGATGVLFFKLSSKKATFRISDWITNWKLIIGLIFYALATITLVTALKTGDLSQVYPIYALTYVWVALISQNLLKEKVHLVNWVGVFIIIGGIALATIK